MSEAGGGSERRIAIIGSGPAGYYTAEGLIKQLGERAVIDIIDRLPTPFGLIRAGVAPDHQSIKAVTRRYEAQHGHSNLRFIGNIDVGEDITIDELLALYDAVVLATGAPADRPLGVPGEGKRGVIGSAQFVYWYNGHPDYAGLEPPHGSQRVAVIGNGNVAIDVARVLVKTPEEMRASDLAWHAAEQIHASPITDVHIFGRRGPMQVSFTPKELGELTALAEAVPLANPARMPPDGAEQALEPGQRKVVEHIRSFALNQPGAAPKRVHFHFFAQPAEILGDDEVTGLRLQRTRLENERAVGTDEYFDVACGLVVSCIGYRTAPIPGVPYDEAGGRFRNEEGRIRPGLYCVGWARRGPTGTIGTNRPDGFTIAEQVVADLDAAAPAPRAGPDGLDALIAQRGLTAITFSGWKRIEEAEEARARPGAPREKFTAIRDMLDVAGNPGAPGASGAR